MRSDEPSGHIFPSSFCQAITTISKNCYKKNEFVDFAVQDIKASRYYFLIKDFFKLKNRPLSIELFFFKLKLLN